MMKPTRRHIHHLSRANYLWLALLLSVCTSTSPQAPSSNQAEQNDLPSNQDPGETSPISSKPSSLPSQALEAGEADEATVAPFELTASDGTGLKLVSMKARAVVEEPLAFTELHLTFHNPEDRVREGRFNIDLPPNAAISRFAMKIGDHWQEGEVVERQAAQRAYEDFLHRRQDPALLENKAGNQFSARIFPIPARGHKELILSYSQELPNTSEPYRLLLRGLPELESLDVKVSIKEPQPSKGGPTSSLGGTASNQRVLEINKQNYTPEQDLEVRSSLSHQAMGLRHDNLVVARISPVSDLPLVPIDGLTILFDTSASRALGFARQVRRLEQVIQTLRTEKGAKDFPLRVVCFDQDLEQIYEGPASGFGSAQLNRIVSRRPLGASNLEAALFAVSKAPSIGSRLLVVSDGIATAGATEGADLRKTASQLAKSGFRRIDAMIDGGIQDPELLKQLTTVPLADASQAQTGTVIDARLPLETISYKLHHATLAGVEVSVAGAEWVWPKTLEGVQPGDEVLIYADLPKNQPMRIQLSGTALQTQEVPLIEVARPLLERAWVGARIRKLMDQRAQLGDADRDMQEALKNQILTLSTRHRVLTPFTALLVLETEWDYQRFHIDRNALTDILTVEANGVGVIHRQAGALPNIASPPPPVTIARPMKGRGEDWDEEDRSSLEDRGGSANEVPMDRRIENVIAREEVRDIAGSVTLGGAPAAAEAPEASFEEVEAKAEEAPMDRKEKRASSSSEGFGRARASAPAIPPAPPPPAPKPTSQFPSGPLAQSTTPVNSQWQPRPDPNSPYTDRFLVVMQTIEAGERKKALELALTWRSEQPGDVLALIALGEALEANGNIREAIRAYGSIIDLFPSRADLRRYAGQRLERLGNEGLQQTVDTYAKAVEQRPDHPSSHRLYAFALLRMGKPQEAFAALLKGYQQNYPEGRFRGVREILQEDLGILAAAWFKLEPQQKNEIEKQLREAGATLATKPSLRFILNWETDANDVDFHIRDGKGGHAWYSNLNLESGGRLFADVTTGYGPECFAIEGTPQAYPYTMQAHYYSRGPMGYGMGKLEIMEHDGQGGLKFDERPFLIMKDQAYLDLGVVKGPLQSP